MNKFIEEWNEIDNSHVIITPNHIAALRCAMAERQYISNLLNENIFDFVGEDTKYTRRTLKEVQEELYDSLFNTVDVLQDEDFFEKSNMYSNVILKDYFKNKKESEISQYFYIDGGNLITNSSLVEGCKRFKEAIKGCHILYKPNYPIGSTKGWRHNSTDEYYYFNYTKPNEAIPEISLIRTDVCGIPLTNSYDYYSLRYFYSNTLKDYGSTPEGDYEDYSGEYSIYLRNIYLLWEWAISGTLFVYVEGESKKYIDTGLDWEEEKDFDFFDFGSGLKQGWNEIGTFNCGDLVELVSFGKHSNEGEEGESVGIDDTINLSDGSFHLDFPGIGEEKVKYECTFRITKIKIDFKEGFTYK